MTLRIGIVGLNNQGLDHIDGVLRSSRCELRALADPGQETLQRALQRLPQPHTVACHDSGLALLASGKVDAAILAVPHDLHPTLVQEASRRGVHLLKEKPLGRNLREAHEQARDMRQRGLVLHTGVQRRHHPVYQALARHLTEARGLGRRLRSASLTMTIKPREQTPGAPAPITWRQDFTRAGGGVLVDLGYHGVDLMHWLLGPLTPVSCTLWNSDRLAPRDSVESDASVWAQTGEVAVHMRFGRAERKTEELLLECNDGQYRAGRTGCFFETEGARETIAEGADGWQAALDLQLESFLNAIERGDHASNDLDTQIPALAFIERCYDMHRSQGWLEGSWSA